MSYSTSSPLTPRKYASVRSMRPGGASPKCSSRRQPAGSAAIPCRTIAWRPAVGTAASRPHTDGRRLATQKLDGPVKDQVLECREAAAGHELGGSLHQKLDLYHAGNDRYARNHVVGEPWIAFERERPCCDDPVFAICPDVVEHPAGHPDGTVLVQHVEATAEDDHGLVPVQKL